MLIHELKPHHNQHIDCECISWIITGFFSIFQFLFPVFKETNVSWLVVQAIITTATDGPASPVIGRVPPAQVSHIFLSNLPQPSVIPRLSLPEVCSFCFCFLYFVCPGTGIEACTKCADGYLLEDWRCVTTCSGGYYLSEQTSENGQVQRSCKKWVGSSSSHTSNPLLKQTL